MFYGPADFTKDPLSYRGPQLTTSELSSPIVRLFSTKLTRKVLLPAAIAFVLVPVADVHAQAIPGSSRLFEVSSFASFGRVNTNYPLLGPSYAGQSDTGYVFGTNLSHHFAMLQPSLEIRSTFTNGSVVRERMFGGGLGVEKTFGKVTPFADLLIGSGVITFPGNKTLPYDSSVVLQYGGGVNVRVRGPWALRFDVQEQSWHTGAEVPRFYPTSFTGGFSYRPRPAGYGTR